MFTIWNVNLQTYSIRSTSRGKSDTSQQHNTMSCRSGLVTIISIVIFRRNHLARHCNWFSRRSKSTINHWYTWWTILHSCSREWLIKYNNQIIVWCLRKKWLNCNLKFGTRRCTAKSLIRMKSLRVPAMTTRQGLLMELLKPSRCYTIQSVKQVSSTNRKY